ncbi:MAG: DUF4846 domain-containing protein [Patescibacteria group bacterium]|nr:DUF4846 domain-containing protein [Patescibacteria group bacterium]
MEILVIFLFLFIFAFLGFYFQKISYWKTENLSFCKENCGFEGNPYFWLPNYNIKNSLCSQIAPPYGYQRISVKKNSFEEWLRYLPLKEGNPPILLYNGKKAYQFPHQGIIDIDIGSKNLQQCADAIIRLRAEYLFTKKDYQKIHFNFVSGFKSSYLRWREGFRPIVVGDLVKEIKLASFDDSWKSFREYLNSVFNYANTFSLEKEMVSVKDINEIKIGDIFIQGGFPGHTTIVVDLAENERGEKVFLLAQSNRPAQDIHILKNPNNFRLSPWYSANFGEILKIPGWTFKMTDLKRFQ